MTNRPDRPITIVPPPVDRERKTDPPTKSDHPPPEVVTLADQHGARLTRTEAELIKINKRLDKVDELHALFMGAPPTEPGGKPRPSIIAALHDLVGSVGVAGANSELVAEQQQALPRLIAQEVANKMMEIYQVDIKALREADAALLARVEKLAESAGAGPNGNGPHR